MASTTRTSEAGSAQGAMMSIEEILAHAEVSDDDAHSAQGADVVHDESDGDAHFVQGEDNEARSAHGENSSSADEARPWFAGILKIARGAQRRGRKASAQQRLSGGRRRQFVWGSRAHVSNVAARQIRGRLSFTTEVGAQRPRTSSSC